MVDVLHRYLPYVPQVLARAILPTVLMEASRGLWGATFSWTGLLGRLAMTVLLLTLAAYSRPHPTHKGLFAWRDFVIPISMITSGIVLYLVLPHAISPSWILLVGVYILLFGFDEVLASPTSWAQVWGMRLFLAFIAGAAPVALAQVESRFADEEFFVVLQVAVLSLYWLLLRLMLVSRTRKATFRTETTRRGNRRITAILLCLAVFAGGIYVVRAYQWSFYAETAPGYEGISAATPFICGASVGEIQQGLTGREVFEKLLAMVEQNPDKGVPEYGMLALGMGAESWAEMFREGLLLEARRNAFAGPAHSVKFQQYLAALRLYYFIRIREAFPDLFTERDLALLELWFSNVNSRALKVEWVDLMYALAFTKWPEGPYDNQEVGAAFLSLVEVGGSSSSELSLANRTYLESNLQGWHLRFRNTDDAFAYQPEWITNAYFQSLFSEMKPASNLQNSFEWLLLQSLPGGEPLGYNHPGTLRLAGIYYMGAQLLDDPRYLWLAEESLRRIELLDVYPFAQPGVDAPVALKAQAPEVGSCLLYGDSGLPNQVGPLAPDKVVLRGGWSNDAPYLLMNLRFTGWHRYKATNSIPLMYWHGPVVVEAVQGASIGWLPEGRSLFRDKRIPRDRLNGVVVERTGFSALVHDLTGSGGSWAQDPPHYAEVLSFETGPDVDFVHTRLVGWRGWAHDRWIYFHHDQGPIVVVDEAVGPARRRAGITWHLPAETQEVSGRLSVRSGEGPVAIELVTLDEATYDYSYRVDQTFNISAEHHGDLHLATVFLLGEWAGASVEADLETQMLTITGAPGTIILPIPSVAPENTH